MNLAVLAIIIVVVFGGVWSLANTAQKQRAEQEAAEAQARAEATASLHQYVERAKMLRDAGDLGSAIIELDSAIALHKADSLARINATNLLKEIGGEYGLQFEADVDALLRKARQAISAGEPDEAERIVQDALSFRFAPNRFEAEELLRQIRAKRGESTGSAGRANHDSPGDEFESLLIAGRLQEAKSLIDKTPHIATLRTQSESASLSGDTALHVASRYGNAEIVRTLIEAGANIEARNSLHLTPLWYCLHRNASEEIVEVVSALLAAGAKVNLEPGVEQPDWSSVQYVLLNPDLLTRQELAVKVLNVLGDAGLDVNARDRWQSSTALHMAAHSGLDLVCRWLLAHGAEVNAAGKSNVDQGRLDPSITPLSKARTALARLESVDDSMEWKATEVVRLQAVIKLLQEHGGR